jgi:ligand-binding SRPBCC domain-containing protein
VTIVACHDRQPSGRRRRLTSTLLVPRSLDEVFAFFADPGNLDRLTPPWLRFRIATPLPLVMRQGMQIDYRLRIRGLPLRWTSRITEWEPPHGFTDLQVRGPYRYWRHQHRFRAVAGGTECEDIVDFEGRGGWAEPLLHRMFVGPDLRRIFEFRRCALQRIFAGDARLHADHR